MPHDITVPPFAPCPYVLICHPFVCCLVNTCIHTHAQWTHVRDSNNRGLHSPQSSFFSRELSQTRRKGIHIKYVTERRGRGGVKRKMTKRQANFEKDHLSVIASAIFFKETCTAPGGGGRSATPPGHHQRTRSRNSCGKEYFGRGRRSVTPTPEPYGWQARKYVFQLRAGKKCTIYPDLHCRVNLEVLTRKILATWV